MTRKYESVSIEEAIAEIIGRRYLLPAIQRKFVWDMGQICVLFDSIMRGYSINTFMMWEITDPDIKNDHKFYDFLPKFIRKYGEDNNHTTTSGADHDFKAIIDGQQRLNSFYIGLHGTYEEKRHRAKWGASYNPGSFLKRKLYLDLNKSLKPEDNDGQMEYNFRFLTEEECQDLTSSATESDKPHWFCLHKVLEFPKVAGTSTALYQVIKPYLEKAGLSENRFAEATLSQLYDVIRSKDIIHYCNEESQELDHVLDIFLRTNSGGTKLEHSDLLISVTIANWVGDFRGELEALTKQIRESKGLGFTIDRDWILKASLMLTDADVKLKVQNFKTKQVKAIEKEWKGIKACILATFRLICQLGINSESLASKNAVIPICYYLYKKKGLYHSINKPHKNHEQREKIGQWFYMTLLKKVFSGHSYSLLIGIRKVLKDNISKKVFPLKNIVEKYKKHEKDLRIDDEYIDELLSIDHGDNRCRPLLHLLFSEIDPSKELHIDHLHPSSAFTPKKLEKHDFLSADPELMNFYKEHWNSIPNLHLLEGSWNLSKKDKTLAEWIKADGVYLDAQKLLVDDGDLEFKNFKQFYEKRRANLKIKLEGLIFKSDRI